MNREEREAFMEGLEEELMLGGYLMSEWVVVIVNQCHEAFVAGADLPAIVTAAAAIETFLRSEVEPDRRTTLAELIDQSGLSEDLIRDLHGLRKYRNKWVHVATPEDDELPLSSPELVAAELLTWSKLAMRSMLRTIYSEPWV